MTKKRKITFVFNAPVTLTFVLVCLVVLAFNELTNYQYAMYFCYVYRSGWLNPLTYLRMFTYVFGHSGWSHFINNMMYVLILGPMIEEKYGSKNLIKMILIAAFAGGLLNVLLFPNTALCGASGIVFMMIVLASATSFKRGQIPVTMILVILVYLGQEIYEAVAYVDNISQLTHVIGGVCGAVFGVTNANYNRNVS